MRTSAVTVTVTHWLVFNSCRQSFLPHLHIFFYLFFVRFMYDPRSHVQQNGGRGEKMDQSL
jgi:hypothetical protein